MRIIVGELVEQRQTWELLSDGGMSATITAGLSNWNSNWYFGLEVRGLSSPNGIEARSLYEAIRWYREVVGDYSPLTIAPQP